MSRAIKISLVSLALSMLLTINSIQPSSAIFGLSKCEKVEKSIFSETKVGNSLYKKYNRMRATTDFNLRDTNYRLYLEKAEDLLDSLVRVLKSDIKAWSKASRNPSCYNAEQSADIRYGLDEFKENLKIASDSKKDRSFYNLKFSNVYTSRGLAEKFLTMK